MTSKFYVGDTPLIKLDCVSDISTASGVLIKYRKPDGVTGEWNGTVVDNRYVTYQIPNVTVLDQAGDWKFQAFMHVGQWIGHGETDAQTIHERFK